MTRGIFQTYPPDRVTKQHDVTTGCCGNPFRGSPIVTPGEEIDCSETCSRSHHCQDWPLRMCGKDPHCDKAVCLHKQLFPMLPLDVTFFFVIFMVSFLAGAPGIGGGGINVPLLMMLNRFTIKEAVPISHPVARGNALSQLLFNTRLRHPSMSLRPLIHYEIAAVLLPAMLGGNSLGIVVSKFKKDCDLLRLFAMVAAKAEGADEEGVDEGEEAEKMAVGSGGAASSSASKVPKKKKGLVAFRNSGPAKGSAISMNNLQRPVPDVRSKSFEDQMPRIPWKTIWFMYLVGLQYVIFCLNYLAMSQDVDGVEKCSVLYWIALLGLYPVVALSLLLAIRFMRELAEWHASRHDPPVQGDPVLGRAGLVVVPFLAMAVGLLAGLLGLGGGEFMVPLLLELGVQARVAAATSGFLIFFNTSSNVVHYLVAGTIEPFMGYGIACFFMAGQELPSWRVWAGTTWSKVKNMKLKNLKTCCVLYKYTGGPLHTDA
ncbi:unnamed protein product [Cladocopium goreaui]|uniref:Sulfite exporter TauE/SafE family protein 3 n=1 Tax=Cladocopium goreaui TaxID=2562237 RepID=A0A9P1CP40_9DINO|nr:unnamed protein product [Cladocopium goreaui]